MKTSQLQQAAISLSAALKEEMPTLKIAMGRVSRAFAGTRPSIDAYAARVIKAKSDIGKVVHPAA